MRVRLGHPVFLPEPFSCVKKTLFSIVWLENLLTKGHFLQESGVERNTEATTSTNISTQAGCQVDLSAHRCVLGVACSEAVGAHGSSWAAGKGAVGSWHLGGWWLGGLQLLLVGTTIEAKNKSQQE